MADESIEALERAWQDLFKRILKAGREQGERDAFDRILRSIQAAATEIGAASEAQTRNGAHAGEEQRHSVVPIRSGGREWDPPGGTGDDRDQGA